MRKILLFLVLLLVIPLPFTQLLVNSLTVPEDVPSDFVYSLNYDPSSDFVIEDKIIRIISIEEGNAEGYNPISQSLPHLSAANYPTISTTTGNASDVQRGEIIDASSLTEYELLGFVPVDRGDHYWYDLVELSNDNDATDGSLDNTSFAIEFTVPVTTDLMAIGFNLSEITTYISNVITVYVTDNLSSYSSDYLMTSEISFHTYNFHKNNPSSETLFSFWNHPTTTQVDNHLTADVPYYIVLESAGNFDLQTSSDLSGTDDNRVYINDTTWIEQVDLDVDLTIFTGSLLQTTAVASGQSTILYDTSFVSGINHVLVASYYDSSLLYDCSSDYLEIKILDSFNPDYLTLTSPPSAEYSDDIQLIAKVENGYLQPLQGELVDFYYSSDNLTWVFLTQEISNENGYAIATYTIDEASGTKYFKAILNLLASYSSTDQQKEIVNVLLPQIDCRYGSAPGYHDLAQYEMNVRIIDNDNQPFYNQMVIFFIQGSLDPIFLGTNTSGWASSGYGFLDWGAGYYPNSFWVTVSMDSDYYIYQPTTYSDINIARSPLFLQHPDNLQNYWNEPVDINLSFNDTEGDVIPYQNYEVILYSYSDDQNTSLGLYQTDILGEGVISFNSGFFNPGEYEIYIKVDSADYFYLDESIALSILSDQAEIAINISESESYVYGSDVPLEIYVTNHFGDPLENIEVLVHVSLVNYPDFWDEFFTAQTNSSGYATLSISFDLQVGDILNILVTTSDYIVGGHILYGSADSFVSYFSCIPAPTEITEITDLTGINQDVIYITGRVVSNGNPVIFETITIHILGKHYPVLTDGDGYFTLQYTIEQGGSIPVLITFSNSLNYNDSNKTITLTSSACSVIIYSNEIYHNDTNPVEFTIYVESTFGTAASNAEVNFFWFDGDEWRFLGTEYTDASGYATLNSAITFPLGIFQWKAEVVQSDDWLANESTQYFQVGILTTISTIAPPVNEYKQSILILANVMDEFNQPLIVEVSFYLNGTLIGTAFTNTLGTAVFNWIIDFAPGNYVLYAQVMETGMYFSSSDSRSFVIEKTQSYISCEDTFIFYGEDYTLPIHLYSAASDISAAYLDIDIAGTYNTQLLTDFEGKAYWLIPTLEPGIYTVVIDFSGDSFYYAFSLSITLQVDKMPTTIDFDAPNQNYESIYTVSGYIEDEFNQPIGLVTVSLLVNGSVVQIDITDSFGYFSFSMNLLPGTYVIEIEYIGDDHFLSSIKQKTVYIWKIDTSIQCDVVWDNLTLSVSALLVDDLSGPLSDKLVFFYLNGTYVDHETTNSSGYAIFTLNGIQPGVYVIEVVFSGTSIYEESSKTIVLDQEKLQTEMSVQVSEGIYGSSVTTIEVYLTSNSTPISNEFIKVLIDGVEYIGLTNSSGYLTMFLDLHQDAGTYTLDVIFEGSLVYSVISLSTSFSISKAEALIDLIFQYVDFQPIIQGSLITTTTLEGEQIEILVEFIGYDSLLTNELGEFETVLLLSAGTYYVTASFAGNSNYSAFEKTIQVDIHKTTTTINVQNSCNQTFDSETTFGFYLLDVLNNPLETSVIIKLDGVYYTTVNTDMNGYAEILLIASINAGIHTITIEYQGDVNYYQTSSDVILYTKYDVIIEDLLTQPEVYGTMGSISGKIDDYSGDLILVLINLEIDGQVFSVYSDINGNFLFTLDKYLPAGDYQVKIFVIETDYINSFEHIFSITRGKGTAIITIDTTQFVFNENIIIEGLLTFDSIPLNGVEIVIYVNSIEFGRFTTDIEGKFYLPASLLSIAPDNYTLQISALIDDHDIAATSQDFILEILKDTIRCDFYWGDPIVENEIEMRIILQDSANNLVPYYTLEVDINGTIYEFTTNQLGTIRITHTLTDAGNFQVLISGIETTYFLAFQQLKEFDVEKAETEIIVVLEDILYNSSIGLEIGLQSEFENLLAFQPLLIQINSTIYTVYTSENGSVIIDMSEYQLGTYKVLIDFQGSKNYVQTTLTVYVEIVPQNTQIKIGEEGDFIAFYLLDSENRSLSNREITVDYLDDNQSLINAEIFNTDNNGLIFFDILSSDFISTSYYLNFTFNGDAYYEACNKLFKLADLNVNIKKFISPTILIEASVAILGLAGLLSLRHLLRRRK